MDGLMACRRSRMSGACPASPVSSGHRDFYPPLRDAHRFGFESLSAMKNEADKYLAVALEIVGRFPDVAGY